MDSKTSLVILGRVKEIKDKRAMDGLDPSASAFSGALQDMAATQLRSDAMRDVGNVGMTALGVGAAGRGLVGLIQHLRSNKAKKTRSGPAYLPLPFPASPEKTGNAKILALLGGAGKKVGGILGQGAKDLQLGLGVGQPSRDLANLTAKVRGGYSGLAQGVDDAANIRPALDPLGRTDGRMATNAAEEVQFLNHSHTPNRVNSLLSDLAAMNRSKARGSAMVNVGAGVGGGVAGNQLAKQGGFLDGGEAATKSGIPWYGPAMLLGGLGGLGLGWKGMDKVLDARRQKQMDGELESARQQFHDALLSQYDKPVSLHPELMKSKSAADATMVKVGEELDAVYDKYLAAMAAEEKQPTEKRALDLSNMAGQAAGGYGMYAALSGLLTGSLVYDKMSKRSRGSVLNAALKKRQRRRFMQQPTEIYAQPEPVPVPAG